MNGSNHIIIVGAGAAGLMAAIWAADGLRRVTLFETTSDGGRKILISGGGRCNALPSSFEPEQFHTDSSTYSLRNILRSWPGDAMRRFFENDLGIPLMLEPETGKLFPISQKARQVRDRLKAAAEKRGGGMVFNRKVTGLTPPDGSENVWKVHSENHVTDLASSVILATGGLSVPQTGSDGAGLRIARSLGHTIRPTYPALTPLTLHPPRYAHLSGISCPVILQAPRGKRVVTTQGGFLFTHRGYSGPATLDISHLAVRSMETEERQPLSVNWTQDTPDQWDKRLRSERGTPRTLLRRMLPERLVDTLLAEIGVAGDQFLTQMSRETRRRLVNGLTEFPLPWTGSEGYKKAEVTGGGVALEEVDPATMESRLHPGLFLCGEMLDAFGPIGGYNFAWAWATGRLAGLGARKRTM